MIERASADDLTVMLTDVGPAPMQVGAVLLLETPGGFDTATGRDVLAERITAIPRLRQRLVAVPFGFGRPIWIDDEDFDIDLHVKTVDAPANGDPDALLALAAELATSRLPRDHPLWSATFVTGVGSGRTAIVVVFHHVLADGIGGLAVLAGLVDGASGSESVSFPRPPPSKSAIALDASRERLRRLAGLRRSPQRIRAMVGELRAAHGRRRAPQSSLNRSTGGHRRIAVAQVGLAAIREVAHANGGSVNDVVLSAIGGALQRLLSSRGEKVERIVVSVPVSQRRATVAEDLGNQVGVASIEVPWIEDNVERLASVVERGAELRAAPRGASGSLLGPIFRTLARLRGFSWFISRQRMVNTFVTNLRGPDSRLSFLAAPVAEIVPISGIEGNVTAAFGVLSYAGVLAVTIIVDPDACPELTLLREALQCELDEHSALLG